MSLLDLNGYDLLVAEIWNFAVKESSSEEMKPSGILMGIRLLGMSTIQLLLMHLVCEFLAKDWLCHL